MPWKESCPMSERLKFVGRYLDGERITDLCREFEISRKTGYKLIHRYETAGGFAFGDLPRTPKTHPNQTPLPMENDIINLRQEHPTWGAPKIKSYLERTKTNVPAKSTVHCILQRNDLIKVRQRRSLIAKSKGTHLSVAEAPNDLWCVDFKGQFRLGNKKYCYPLTVSDEFSRFVLACEAFESTAESPCIEAFHRLFLQYGLPDFIKSDNGVPFSSRSFFGLSKLSLFWVRLGIGIERITPGRPDQNGCHERMHRTLKADATKPPSSNLLSQQERFDGFREVFNCKRPHEALLMKSPADIYVSSSKKYDPDINPIQYPDHDITTKVTKCGSIFVDSRRLRARVYLGIPFGDYRVGLRELDGGIWQVNFMHHLLGYFDLEKAQIQIPVNPFLKS